jgi:transcriptional regulator with XRE-family HTH domain
MSYYARRFLENVDAHLHKLGRRRPWLAEQTGISLNTINTWFSQARTPRMDHAYQVAECLGVTLEYLISGESFYERYDHITERIIKMVRDLSEQDRGHCESALGMFLVMKQMGYRAPRNGE